MAKGSPFTTFTGKLGQIVGYIIKNAASKQSQGMRAYQPNVANPKTVLQANQRLCLKPLNNFARALAPVIGRGFENVRYGTESRREFMRINMSNFNGPYLRKGNDDPVPGPFVISKGSLVPVSVLQTLSGESGNRYLTDLYEGNGHGNTLGTLSQAWIDNNTDIRDGDQLTFIECDMVSGEYVYRVFSIVVNSTSAKPLTELPIAFLSTTVVGEESKFTSFIARVARLDENTVMCGAAVIQSRESEFGTHLRSDAVFWVTPGVYDVWMSQEQYEAALSSYMGDTAVVDWPVQQTAESAVILQESISVHVPATDLVGQSAENFPDGVDVMGFVMSDGTIGVWVDGENELIDMLGRRISYVVTEQTFYVTLASTSTIPTRIYFGGVVSV